MYPREIKDVAGGTNVNHGSNFWPPHEHSKLVHLTGIYPYVHTYEWIHEAIKLVQKSRGPFY